MKKKRGTERTDRANAFVMEPGTNEGPVPDGLAEYLGENFLSSATGGEDSDQVLHDDVDIDELGGPFIETDSRAELSASDDGDEAGVAAPEAFPTAVRGDRVNPIVRRRR